MRLQNEMPTMNFSQDAGAEQGNGNSRLTMIEGVDYLINEGYSIYEIAKILHTTTRSVGAYKAHITRRKKIAMPQISQLEKYLHDTYVVIPTGLIHEKLQNGQKKNLADILDTLFGEGLEKKTKEGGLLPPLPDSKVREIIIECKSKGMPNNEVYLDPRLINVSQNSIQAYLAHYTRGSYDKERRQD